MTMDINDMKDTFLANTHESAEIMLDFIRNDLKIDDSYIWNYIGYDVVSVNPKEYEHVLKEGKKFACKEDFGLWWINHYNERRGPIVSCDIGYCFIQQEPIEGEVNDKKERIFWIDDDYTPKCIVEYLKDLKDYLKVKELNRDYSSADRALRITPLSLDYEAQSALFKEFVTKNGYGPFETIHTINFDGSLNKEPILVKKKTIQ